MDPRLLTDHQLAERMSVLIVRERDAIAEVVAHLAEVDRRRFYLEQACSSLYSYCCKRLGYNESAAYKRARVAQLARRVPRVMSALREGTHHLTGLVILAQYLNEGSAERLLEETRGLSCRELRQFIARRYPKSDVFATLTRAPGSSVRSGGPRRSDGVGGDPRAGVESPKSGRSQTVDGAHLVAPCMGEKETDTAGGRARPASTPCCEAGGVEEREEERATCKVRSRVEPLSGSSSRIEFTAGATMCEKLERASELLSHAVPSGNIAAVLERGLDALIAQLERRLMGSGRRQARPADEVPRSRHVPRAISRRVWHRDGGQCTYVDDRGRRCGERRFLTIEHRKPFARGGRHVEDNLCLLCAAHNAHAARRVFGERDIARKVARARRRARLRSQNAEGSQRSRVPNDPVYVEAEAPTSAPRPPGRRAAGAKYDAAQQVVGSALEKSVRAAGITRSQEPERATPASAVRSSDVCLE